MPRNMSTIIIYFMQFYCLFRQSANFLCNGKSYSLRHGNNLEQQTFMTLWQLSYVCILYCCITMWLVSNAKICWSRSFPSIPPQPVQQLWSPDEESAENCSYFLPRVPLGALITQQRQRHGLQWQQDSSQPGLQGQYKLTSSVLRTMLETLSLFVLLYHFLCA